MTDYGRDDASRLAAELFIANVLRLLNPLDYTVKASVDACLPFLAIDWGRQILGSIGGRRFNNFTTRLRISKLPKDLYIKIISATKFNESDESAIIPCELEDWRG